jgi:guanine deaminase
LPKLSTFRAKSQYCETRFPFSHRHDSQKLKSVSLEMTLSICYQYPVHPPPTAQDLDLMKVAIELAAEHMRARDGGPFGAVIARGDEIIARGWNRVTSTNDPTAHAEITAIRAAGLAMGSFQLGGCVLYTSCEPCPMCLGAAYWARLDRIVFAGTRADAASAGFDDAELYQEMALPIVSRKMLMQAAMREEAVEVFSEWIKMPDKTMY